MKPIIGAVSATLLIAAIAGAQAGPLVPSGTSTAPLYQPVSDLDGPYYSDAPPPPAPIPVPRYGYGPGPEYGYRPPAPVYGPDPDRREPYPGDGYRQDYGYAPVFLPVHEVYAIIRGNGFSPLGAPRQRGAMYVVSVLDRDGEDGRLLIDARSGRIIRFVPAFQSGEAYERMRYEPGRDLPIRPLQAPLSPRASLDSLPPPTVIKADPRLLHATPSAPIGSQLASRAMPAPKPAAPATRPAAPAPQTAAVAAPPPAPAAPIAPPAPAAQKPAPQILPTEQMPPVQGLE